MKTSRWQSPYVVMTLVLVMYVIKVASKTLVGSTVNSPMIYGDGLHNLSDIFEALLVIGVIWISNLKRDNYPYGLRKLQNFGEIATGLSLAFMSLEVARRALSGLVALHPATDAAVRQWLPLPVHEPLKVGGEWFPLVAGLMAVSAVLSYFVGRYQISVGRRSGQAALVADGHETWSDGRVELAVLTGIIGEYVFHQAWLEYPFALLVAGLMMKTSFEILRSGFRSLLQRSLGTEVETELKAAVSAVPGVEEIADLTTYPVGPLAVVEMKIRTNSPASAHDDLRFAIKNALRPVLAQHGFAQSKKVLSLHLPKRQVTRIAVVAVKDGSVLIAAPSLAAASHVRICTVEGDEVTRAEDFVIDPRTPAFLALLETKRVEIVRCGRQVGDAAAWRELEGRFACVPADSFTLVGLGL